MPPTIDLTVPSYLTAFIVGYYALLFCLAWRRQRPRGEPVSEPVVVFIVPARNEASVLGPTVRIALDQQYGGELRVLVIDDASVDETGALADALTSADARVRALHRDRSVGGAGKSDVLNHGYRYIREAIQRRDPWLEGGVGAGTCICVLDADGHLTPNATASAVGLLGDERVGAVQIGVQIRNARANLLTRLQDIEFVGFSYMVQVARDRLGSVGLGGNGQYARLRALETLGDAPWRSTALTEDLDLGLRLQLAGWRLRFSSSAHVAQEGLTRIRPLIRQRTRWTHGHYQCWRYIRSIATAPQVPMMQRLDTLAYLVLVLLVVLVTVIGAVDALGALNVVCPVDSFLGWMGEGIARRTVEMCVTWLPVLMVFFTYQRFAAHRLHGWETPAYCVYFAVYVYIWAFATIRAWLRIAMGRGAWSKTPREAAPAYTDPCIESGRIAV